MRQLSAFAALSLAAASACAPKPGAGVSGGTATPSATAPANRNRDIITKEELSASNVSSLSVLDAVRSLRPHFLSVRGQNTMPAKEGNDPEKKQIGDTESGKVHASIDGNKIVSIEELAGLRAGTVVEVRFLSPAAAMQRFGSTARQGPVILVKTM
jgi:hypothetical protein